MSFTSFSIRMYRSSGIIFLYFLIQSRLLVRSLFRSSRRSAAHFWSLALTFAFISFAEELGCETLRDFSTRVTSSPRSQVLMTFQMASICSKAKGLMTQVVAFLGVIWASWLIGRLSEPIRTQMVENELASSRPIFILSSSVLKLAITRSYPSSNFLRSIVFTYPPTASFACSFSFLSFALS